LNADSLLPGIGSALSGEIEKEREIAERKYESNGKAEKKPHEKCSLLVE